MDIKSQKKRKGVWEKDVNNEDKQVKKIRQASDEWTENNKKTGDDVEERRKKKWQKKAWTRARERCQHIRQESEKTSERI